MKTIKELEEQRNKAIAKINSEYERDMEIVKRSLGLGFFSTDNTIFFKLREIDLELISDYLKKLVEEFPPTANYNLTFAGKEDRFNASPFRLGWKNGIRDHSCTLQWKSYKWIIICQLPMDFYKEVRTHFKRKVFDTELHYFGGFSRKQINEMQISAYECFKFMNQRYYGGDVVTFVDDNDLIEDFEYTCLNGKFK